MEDIKRISFWYTNWRGEYGLRTVTPIALRWSEGNEYAHGLEPQWILHAFDHDRQAERYFVLKHIKGISDNAGLL